jgi:hypothetical protein
VLVDKPRKIVEPEVVQDRLDATILGQRQEYVRSVRTTLSPVGRDRDGPLQNCLGGTGSQQPAQHKLIAHTDSTNDGRVQLPARNAALEEQVADRPLPTSRQGKQEMLGLNTRPSEHPRLVLGQQKHIRRVTAKQTH